MNITKLLDKAEEFLNSNERKRKEKKKYLKKVIRKLKEHEHELKESLEKDSLSLGEKERMEAEIKLAHAHRKKGIEQLKGLKKKSKKD